MTRFSQLRDILRISLNSWFRNSILKKNPKDISYQCDYKATRSPPSWKWVFRFFWRAREKSLWIFNERSLKIWKLEEWIVYVTPHLKPLPTPKVLFKGIFRDLGEKNILSAPNTADTFLRHVSASSNQRIEA